MANSIDVKALLKKLSNSEKVDLLAGMCSYEPCDCEADEG